MAAEERTKTEVRKDQGSFYFLEEENKNLKLYIKSCKTRNKTGIA